MNKYYNVQILVFIIASTYFCNCQEQPHHPLGYCANPECSTPIAEALAHTRYIAPERGMLSFEPGAKVLVYLIRYGPKEHLGVEINGRRGYIPNHLVQETKRLIKPPYSPAAADFQVLSAIQSSSQFHSDNGPDLSSYPAGVVPTQAQVFHSQSLNYPSDAQNLGYMSPSQTPHVQDPNSLPLSHFSGSVNIPNHIMQNTMYNPSQEMNDQLHSSPNSPQNSMHVSALNNQPNLNHQYHASPNFVASPNTMQNIPASNEFNQLNIPHDAASYPNALPLASSGSFFPPSNLDPSLNMHINSQPVVAGNQLISSFQPSALQDSISSQLQMSPELINTQDTLLQSIQIPDETQQVNEQPSLPTGQYSLTPDFQTLDNVQIINPQHASSQIIDVPSVKTDPSPSPSVVTFDQQSSSLVPDNLDSSQSSSQSSSDSFISQSSVTPQVSFEPSAADEAEYDKTMSMLQNRGLADQLSELPNSNEKISKTDDSVLPTGSTQKDPLVISSSVLDTLSNEASDDDKLKTVEINLDKFLDNKEQQLLQEAEKQKHKTEEHSQNLFDIHKNEIEENNDGNDESENENEISKDEDKENKDKIEGIKNKNEEDENEVEDNEDYEELQNDDSNKDTDELSAFTDNKDLKMDISVNSDIDSDFGTESPKDKSNVVTESLLDQTISEEEFSSKPTRSILQEDEKVSTLDNEMENIDDPTLDNSKVEEIETSSVTYDTFVNFVAALRTFLDYIISFMPEPLYSYLMNLNAAGISSRAVVFTALMSMPSLCLFLSIFYLKETSKESSVLAQLAHSEHELYLAATERDLLRENVEKLQQQVTGLELQLEDERTLTKSLQNELEGYQLTHQNVSAEQKENLAVIRNLKKQIKDYENTISDLEKSLREANETIDQSQEEIETQKQSLTTLIEKNDKLTDEIVELKNEKESFICNEKVYLDKISEYEAYCNQLCQDAEQRHAKITELSDELTRYGSLKDQLETDIESKNNEIGSLRSIILNFEAIEKYKESGDGNDKIIEEKLNALLDVSSIENKMKKVQMENEILSEKLNEKIKECDENKVVNLELNSEIEKLKALKDQAEEEKVDTQRKLEILEKYFKDKEVLLQKELGTQLNARQQKEIDVSQAERTIYLLKEENASFREQVKTLKHEIEETEHNLKKQITAQEEISHKNWVAARAAERNVDKLKQEIAQFRQRVTLLEREREESFHNLSHEGSVSGEFKPDFPLPPRHLPPPPPMMHPLLPPNMPPPMMPPFVPPFDPMMPPPPRRPPWEKNAPDSRRYNTPPFFDREGGKPSPSGGSSHSRDSSPLPDFHNVPPPSSSRYLDGPPHPAHARFVPPPPGMSRKEIDSKSGHKGPRREMHNASFDRDSSRQYDADV